ncbi:MAG: D-ribose ABC transporter substrate-binding protein [Acetobacteraceae bacterium]
MRQNVSRLTVLASLLVGATLMGQASAATPPAVQSHAGTNGKTIAIFVPSLNNPFFVAEKTFAAAEATKLGYGTMVASHDDNAYTQLNLIKTAIARHVAAIILDNAGADASISAVKAATDAGIPVFLIDREINAKGIAKAQIVSNNFQGAELEATEFAKLLGYKGTYVELTGLPSDTNAKVRADGVASVLKHFTGMKMVAEQTADWSQEKGFQVTQTLLEAHPDIQGLIADNDTMAMGAEAALLAAHKPGVIVTGFDGSPDVVNSIRKGQIKADVLQPIATFSREAVLEADQYLKSRATGKPEKQEIDCILITPANVGKYSNWSMSQ